MEDPDKPYSSQKPSHNNRSNGHLPISDENLNVPLVERSSRSRSYASRSHTDEELDDVDNEEYTPTLPAHGLRTALIIGAVVGLIIAAINFALPYTNTSLYEEAARAGDKIDANLATMVTGLWCLNTLVSFAICAAGGFLIGRRFIQRRFGFYAGLLAGAIVYLGGLPTHYIPNYPGNPPVSNTPAAPAAGGVLLGLVVVIVAVAVWALVGGLVSLLGSWLATRRHPYYLRSNN